MRLFTSGFFVFHILLMLKMIEKLEQQICIIFCFKLEDSCVETIKMMKTAFGDCCMGNTQIKEWHKWFKDGCTSVDSDPHSGWPPVVKKQ